MYQDRNLNIVVDFYSENTGTRNVRDVLIEKNTKDIDSIDFITREIFVNFSFYVNDSIR